MSRTGWQGLARESNGGYPVNVQDQTSRALDLFFIRQLGATTLLTQGNIGDYKLNLTNSAPFLAGNMVGVFTPTGQFFFARQIGPPVLNEITIDTPLDMSYPSGSVAIAASWNMNVNGSISPVIYQIGPVGAGTGISVDITRLLFYIQDGSSMDDALFGGISALVNGIVLRKNDGIIQNIWNIKTNGEFALHAYDAQYTDKAPAGSYGFRVRNTYGGQDKHGVTIRLIPGDTLELIIQDNLTGLEVFNAMAQGHIVTD